LSYERWCAGQSTAPRTALCRATHLAWTDTTHRSS